MLLAAGHAPGGPDIEQPHLALEVGVGDRLRRLLQHRQAERRRRLADQRRGHLARVEVEADAEKADDHHEHRQGQEELLHAALLPLACARRVPRAAAACSSRRRVTTR